MVELFLGSGKCPNNGIQFKIVKKRKEKKLVLVYKNCNFVQSYKYITTSQKDNHFKWKSKICHGQTLFEEVDLT